MKLHSSMVFGSALVVLSALASKPFFADSFEEGTNGMPVACYKASCDASGAITQAVWNAVDGDASSIVATDEPNRSFNASIRPMTGVTSNWVLNLDTQANVLSRPIDGGPRSFAEGPLYVDALVRFTPFEVSPVISNTQLKYAVFVNASSNLVVYHSIDGLTATTSVANATVDPSRWHRLTVRLDIHPSFGMPAFTVFLDDFAVTSGAAYDEGGSLPAEGGTWFLCPASDTSLHTLSFQGTGQIDELAVEDYPGPWVLLTLSFDDALLDVMQNGQALTPNEHVVIGSSVVIDAADWHEIAAVTGSCICVSYSGPTGARVNASAGQLSCGHPATVYIGAQPYSGDYDTGSGLADAGKLGAWAIANSKTEADVAAHAAAWMDDYLMNVAPDTNPSLFIDSITLTDTLATIVVKASAGVDLRTVNGILNVWSSDDLETFTSSGSAHVTVTAEPQVTVSVPKRPGQFLKVSLENADLTPAP